MEDRDQPKERLIEELAGLRRRISELEIEAAGRRTAEAERHENQEYLRNILESIDQAFILIGPDFRIMSANKAYYEQTKLTEADVIGKQCYSVTHHSAVPCYENGDVCAVKHTFDTGEPNYAMHMHSDSSGNCLQVETRSYPLKDAAGRIISVIETISNITERTKLENQLRQSQKFEAIGTLAGGIAHDFNNILTAILGFGEMVRDGMKTDDPLKDYVDLILASAQKASNLTRGLLVFSREEKLSFKPVNINDIISNLAHILSRIIGEDIDIRISLAPEALPVMADSGHMEQVLLNLAANARDAMPAGGSLSVETRLMEIDSDFARSGGVGNAGRYALITVSDTGTGMDERTRERIFEPFFTSKESGKGTGLGLSIVYGIIKQHNGQINVYSEPGKGTIFRIYLPLTGPAAREQGKPEVQAPSRGTETVLVAEDNETVRHVVRSILEKAGYTVIEADDGEDAINKFCANRDSIHVLLLDLVMPKKSGKEAFMEIKKISPGVRALFTSGYNEETVHKTGILDEDVEFISKPIVPAELLRKLKKVLGDSSQPPLQTDLK